MQDVASALKNLDENTDNPLFMKLGEAFEKAGEELALAPDGSLYVVDWHNVLVGHMQHNVRDPNRDHKHGRIFRVTHTKKPLQKKVAIDGQPIEALLENLKHSTDGVRKANVHVCMPRRAFLRRNTFARPTENDAQLRLTATQQVRRTVGAAGRDLQRAEALPVILLGPQQPYTLRPDVGVSAAVAISQVARHLIN